MKKNRIESKEEKAAKAALDFFHQKEKYDSISKEFESKKNAFYDVMEEYFRDINRNSVTFDGINNGVGLSVKRVGKASINWDINKIEKRIDKSIAKRVIKKQYRISDMEGLKTYLKSCGVNPKIFKSFITVEKSVDEKELDNLSETGYISVKQIRGCYTLDNKKPYYTVHSVRK